jgi:ceramide glucosyltransferase
MMNAYAAIWFCLVLTILNALSIGISALRARARREFLPPPPSGPGVTIIRPVCGIDNFCKESLETSFRLDYPFYELIFCVSSASDPVLPLVQCLIARYPERSARMVIGDENASRNPKLNDCARGWDLARHHWLILADSNVLMPKDSIQRLLASWRRRTGLVTSMPLGSRPQNLWAELECAFLNTFGARWQYCAEALGLGFAQGRLTLWRREIVEKCGGIRALRDGITEGAAAAKLVCAQGLRITLAESPFEQPLGIRSAAEVWRRQTRWARTRRKTFPLLYLPEIFAGAALPALTAAYAASQLEVNTAAVLIGVALAWYVPEALLAAALGCHISWRMPLFFALRDLMLPFLYADAWLVRDFVEPRGEMPMSMKRAEPGLERG